MKDDKVLLDNVKKLMIARYPRFAQEIANASLQFNSDLPFKSAATDGKNIYFDPDFFDSLSDENKLFIVAHELMHIKFQHMFRMTDKEGNLRDSMIWNVATDAIINANLERDGFKIQEGAVNMPEAIQYNAEELYEKLLKEKQEKQKQSGNGQNDQQKQSGNGQNDQQNQGQNGEGQQGQEKNGRDDMQSPKQGQKGDGQGQSDEQSQSGQNSSNGQQFSDDHGLWKKAFEESQQQNKIKNDKSSNNRQDKEESKQDFDEKNEFQENRQQRREYAKQNIEKMRNQEFQKSDRRNMEFGNVGKAKSILDWRLLLRREVEKTETIWSQRRSIAENNYAYRLEENDVEDEAETEVMIDVSGSVSIEMIKAFLRQLKPILKESKLKVGFFADVATKNFVEIKNNKDIDKLEIADVGSGTDVDSAVRAFSQKREVNKIVFTDGEADSPKPDLKNVNVIWIVYSNRAFDPCCGTVIFVNEEDFNKTIKYVQEADEQEFNM